MFLFSSEALGSMTRLLYHIAELQWAGVTLPDSGRQEVPKKPSSRHQLNFCLQLTSNFCLGNLIIAEAFIGFILKSFYVEI